MSPGIDEEIIVTTDDVLNMLDSFFERRDSLWWDGFYADKEKPIPFFKDAPDEELVSGVLSGRLTGGGLWILAAVMAGTHGTWRSMAIRRLELIFPGNPSAGLWN